MDSAILLAKLITLGLLVTCTSIFTWRRYFYNPAAALSDPEKATVNVFSNVMIFLAGVMFAGLVYNKNDIQLLNSEFTLIYFMVNIVLPTVCYAWVIMQRKSSQASKSELPELNEAPKYDDVLAITPEKPTVSIYEGIPLSGFAKNISLAVLYGAVFAI